MIIAIDSRQLLNAVLEIEQYHYLRNQRCRNDIHNSESKMVTIVSEFEQTLTFERRRAKLKQRTHVEWLQCVILSLIVDRVLMNGLDRLVHITKMLQIQTNVTILSRQLTTSRTQHSTQFVEMFIYIVKKSIIDDDI